MEKLTAWLFLIIGIVWVLPLISVGTGTWGPWVAALALLIIGVTEVMKVMKK